MSFDLRIHFVGLAMYVPEDGKAMHVLLPSAAGHVHAPDSAGTDGPPPHHEVPAGTKKVEEHFARVVLDRAYLDPTSTQLSREYLFVDLQGRLLDLTGLPASGVLNAALTDELPSMDRVADRVDRTLVTALPDHRLAGRVTMDAGALTDYTMGARFQLNEGKPARMALATEWTIRGIRSRKPAAEDGHLYLPGRALPSAQDPAANSDEESVMLPDLYPVGETIHLMVFHTVASQFPPVGPGFLVRKADKVKDPSHHVLAYYSICSKRPDVSVKGALPQAADAALVPVEGAIIQPVGTEIPSLGCVQCQGRLAD